MTIEPGDGVNDAPALKAAYRDSHGRAGNRCCARAISFTTLVLGNRALIWANRSRTRTIPEMLWSRNAPLWVVTGGALALLDLFQFSTLHLNDIAVCVALALASITGIEAAKLIRRYI